jgi:hypothetical protein
MTLYKTPACESVSHRLVAMTTVITEFCVVWYVFVVSKKTERKFVHRGVQAEAEDIVDVHWQASGVSSIVQLCCVLSEQDGHSEAGAGWGEWACR